MNRLKSKIKHIVLDIDGILVGGKTGLNSPNPHPEILKKLQQISNQGIGISLCTAKPAFAIENLIKEAGLNTLHITDGGGVIIDAMTKKICREYPIDIQIVQKIINQSLQHDIYIEVYTVRSYFILASQLQDLTEKHAVILHKEPETVSDFVEVLKEKSITKLMLVVPLGKRVEVTQLCSSFADTITLSWGVHSTLPQWDFGIITANGISKKQGILDISAYTGIETQDMLGVGDSLSDWQFMELCGQVGTLKNADPEIKKLVNSRSEYNSFIGAHVDKNGLLEVFDYFSI